MAPVSTAPHRTALLALLLWTSCDAEPPAAPAPKPVAAAELAALLDRPADVLVDAILSAAHGPLKGRQEMSQCLLRLGESADDPRPEEIILARGQRMRVTRSNRSIDIATPRTCWRAVPGVGVKALEGELAQRLQRLQQLCRAALLEPLYSAVKTSKGSEAGVLQLTRGMTVWTLEVRALRRKDGRASLVPKRLSGPAGELLFESFLDTGVSILPAVLRIGEFGRRHFKLQASGAVFLPEVFEDPLGTGPSEARRIPHSDGGAAPDPGQVRLLAVPDATSLIVQDDSRDWRERCELMNEVGQELGAQGQQAADINFLFEDAGKQWLGLPFKYGGKPFVALPDQQVQRRRSQRALVYYAHPGAYQTRIDEARRALAKAQQKRELRAQGPMRILPHLDEADHRKVVPSAEDLRNMKLRFELPVH